MDNTTRRITKEKQGQGEEEEEELESINRIFSTGFYPSSSSSPPHRSSTTTTNPSSDSAFTQNPNPSFEETLFVDHLVSIEDALNRLRLSHRVVEQPQPAPAPYVDIYGNPINTTTTTTNNNNNNEYYNLGNHHHPHHHPNEFNTVPSSIDYQTLGCQDWLARHIMGQDFNQVPRRSNIDYVDTYLRMLNGGGGGGGGGGGMVGYCGCGNPLCLYPQLSSQQLRRQSALLLADQFRRGASLSNTNGHRQQSYSGGIGIGNRSRRELSVERPEWEWERRFELSRSTTNNRNRLEQQQYTGIPLGECRRRIVALAQDQNGCRYLQSFFEEGKLEDIHLIFSEIKDHIGKLMTDPFGNYLVQKMFEVCSQEQLTQLILSVTRIPYDLVQIAMDLHGNCCVQKLLQLITTQEQISLVMSALGPGALMMTRETNGHHILNLCLKNFTNDDIKYILKKVVESCVDIATDKSGCCILQQFLEHTLGDYRERLVSQITANALLLAQDPYGNYVVQYLLQQRIQRITDDILRQLKGSFVSLSMQKFSSNVVQRCLNESVEERSVEIIRELIDSPKIVMLFQDQFANYVIQTALEVSKTREHIFNAIADLIRVNYQSLRSHPFGKRVISKMNELSRRDRI